MRTGHNNEILVIDGKFIGVNLGADFCAEHEWGIQRLKDKFSIQDGEKVFGVKKRLITTRPSDLREVTHSQKHWKTNKTEKYKGLFLPGHKEQEVQMGFPNDQGLYSAWDEKSFLVLVKDEGQQKYLSLLFEEMLKKNVVMWLGGGHVFQRAGLAFALVDRLPKEVPEKWESHDREAWEVKQEVKKSGIEDRLKAAGKHYFSLSPRREEDGSLIFWLNPREQREDNYGWFTLKDLEEWIEGKGKIPMKKKTG